MSDTTIHPVSVRRTYLIVVSEMLVAQDIAQTIADFDAAADVIFAKCTAEAEAALAWSDTVAIAFVASRPQNFVGSTLAGAISARGGRVVLLGVEAEATGPTSGFDVLSQPFDTDSLIARLRAVGSEEPTVRPAPLAFQTKEHAVTPARRDPVPLSRGAYKGYRSRAVIRPHQECVRSETDHGG